MAERQRFDRPIEALLRRRVTGGVIVAVLLTVFLSFVSWRSARRADQDAYWVSHTHEVVATIQGTSRDVLETQTSARAFALSGQEPLLAHYRTARETVFVDEDALRHLTADNPSQQRRLDVLEPQVCTALEFAESFIAKRRKLGAYPAGSDALEIEGLSDAVRATIRDMHSEETRLLSQRTQTAAAAQRLAMIIAIVGVFLKVGSWIVAFLIIIREIGISYRAQSQLNTLNAELEQRVKDRTASLQSEIADRRRVQEITEHLAAVVESSDDAIISKTLDGTITAWNRGAEKVFGYSAEEAVGKPMALLLPPDRAEEESGILERIRCGESVKHFETIRVPKDGKKIDVSMTISPVVDSTGTIVGASNIARDITPRKFKEEQLRQSEDRFRLFIEHAPAALAMFDREMRYLQVSRRWRTDYGLGERELHGLSHYEILPEVPERWKEIHRRGLAGEVLRGEDDYLDRSDGSVQWISWEVRPWHDRTGEIAGIVIFAEEITERKRAEHGLRDSEEKLRLALDGARLGTWEWDLKTGKLAGSPLSFALFRLPADTDFNFGMFLSMIHPDDRARVDEAMKRTLADHTEYNVEYRLVWPDGSDRWIAAKGRAYQNDAGENLRVGGILFDVTERRQALAAVQQPGPAEGVFLEVSARPLKDDHGNLGGGVAVLRDITERKAAERQIQTLNQRLEGRVVERTAELQVANKELEAFTYSISHDLRAPIRHINGFTKILLEQFRSSLPAEALGHLQLIDHAAARMGQMVDEMLKLARLGRQALTVKVTGLSSLVEDVINLLTLETEGRQVEWRIGQLPFVECDPILMPQVFQNLISNALKYSRPRSPAVIEIGQTEKEGEKVIFVKDNGVGFDMKYSDKLFGVFQRLHLAEEFEGNGIGLATVERIIKKHGGRVWVEAELDRGATFFFTLGDREHFAPARAAVAAGGTL